ncbi:uncharacterized protein FFB20_10397 [Fusarium fujikuroi]|uniref:Uncharacterized protein n=2 Tax=Fusarium fujikuroi TaxID=5127 RepID=S0EB32_GIBF5|nr:uncharacterized protein FFUJ_13918 [Fusarium fujikuroi IMI 58289]KLO90197.1 uncharacterized protein LW93_5654 [Fusarium fujikuroi]KLO93651.1 uncharacterized protein Y057_12220 [Fusarium fujikuroi]KLP14466.1 uncharacterized protein LW94_12793 [Fusarium fujikuroi]QGI67732.1 hypothetical protein CEK27_011703 [Fusarium fujikuroi]QGI84965.1 hypothetical protein CEK25_011694 [Fusarium fujikuroi]
MEQVGEDLRDAFDPVEDRATIRRNLQLYSPPGAQFDSSPQDLETSGLDCLIVLIRWIYSQMLPRYFDKEKRKDVEQRNPLLALAWAYIESDEEKIAWAHSKQHILKLLNSHHSRQPETSFLSLINSPLMKETFWLDNAHFLYRECLIRQHGAQWESADMGPNPAATMVDISTMVVDRAQKPNRSFKKFMETPFKLLEKRDKQILKLCAEPAVIRVHYKTRKDLEPFPFSELQNFRVPVYYIDDIDASAPLPLPNLCLYTLIASVSLATDKERIRTYKFLGEEISPCSYTGRGKRWSLEDKIDGEFMLFYFRAGRVEFDPEIPEIGTLPQDNPTFAFLNKFFDDCKKADENKRGH